jgi:hypothetical protein
LDYLGCDSIGNVSATGCMDDVGMYGFRIRVHPSNLCYPCSKSLRQVFNTITKNLKHSINNLCDLCVLCGDMLTFALFLNVQ